MAGNYSVAAKNLMLDALGAVAVYVSAHTADPGPTGTNECAGSTRAGVTWSAASAGAKLASNTPTITGISITDPVQYVGFWSAASGGTYYGKALVTATTADGGAGTWGYQCGQNALDLAAVASA